MNPFTPVPKTNPLLSLNELKAYLTKALAQNPTVSQINGKTGKDRAGYVHFWWTPPHYSGVRRILWKLNGDTTIEAVRRFLQDPCPRVAHTSTEKGLCVRLGREETAKGWNCYEA